MKGSVPILCPRHCGVDEAGRGPLAGAVFAAAVILDPARPVPGLADSKLLDHKVARERLLERYAAIHAELRCGNDERVAKALAPWLSKGDAALREGDASL